MTADNFDLCDAGDPCDLGDPCPDCADWLRTLEDDRTHPTSLDGQR
jgi:hypothetical protein